MKIKTEWIKVHKEFMKQRATLTPETAMEMDSLCLPMNYSNMLDETISADKME